jgi:hypothetical protein
MRVFENMGRIFEPTREKVSKRVEAAAQKGASIILKYY